MFHEKLDPFSESSLLLQLLFYQKRLNIVGWPVVRARSPFPYERWFMENRFIDLKEKSGEEIGDLLKRLEEDKLVERVNPGTFALTKKGQLRAYGVIQYIVQFQDQEYLPLLQFMDPVARSGYRMADVGCGSGIALIYFIDQYRKRGILPGIAVGLDLEVELLEYARELASGIAPEVTFLQGDAMNLPFEDGSIDILFSSLTLLLLNRKRFLEEARRVLDKKGRLILITTSSTAFFITGMYYLMRGRILKAMIYLSGIFNGFFLHLTGRQIKAGGVYLYTETAPSLSHALANEGFRVIHCDLWKSKSNLAAILAVAEKGE